jgi:hypothetical protein
VQGRLIANAMQIALLFTLRPAPPSTVQLTFR